MHLSFLKFQFHEIYINVIIRLICGYHNNLAVEDPMMNYSRLIGRLITAIYYLMVTTSTKCVINEIKRPTPVNIYPGCISEIFLT